MSASYWEWVREQAKLINSDGCSVVNEWNKDCCLEHDLAYFYGRDPRAAFAAKSWTLAAKISRSVTDKRFIDCMQERSPLHEWSPRAFGRWFGVRAGGWLAWRNHRKVRP